MAVRIKPCFGCPISKTDSADCAALKTAMRSRVSGLGLRTAIFDCPVLLDACAPGTRVVIEQKYMADASKSAWRSEYSETLVARANVPATITTTGAAGFAAVVDKTAMAVILDKAHDGSFKDSNLARFRRRMPFSRIKMFIPEPRRDVCDMGNPKDENGKCDSASGCLCLDLHEQFRDEGAV